MSGNSLAHRADRTLRTGVKVAAGLADVVRRPSTGAVILLYHRVGARSHMSVDLPTDQFNEQMAALASNHRVVSLE